MFVAAANYELTQFYSHWQLLVKTGSDFRINSTADYAKSRNLEAVIGIHAQVAW